MDTAGQKPTQGQAVRGRGSGVRLQFADRACVRRAQMKDLRQVPELASCHMIWVLPTGRCEDEVGKCTSRAMQCLARSESSVNGCSVRQAGPAGAHLPRSLQVDCLVLQLHRVGEQLEKMNRQRMDELFVLIRDGFLLLTDLSSLAQLLLLEIIEFRAAGWKTTPAAHKYYYSEVSD